MSPTVYAQLSTVLREVEGEFIYMLFHLIKEFEQSEHSDTDDNGKKILSQEDQLVLEDKIHELINKYKVRSADSENPEMYYVRTLDVESQALESRNEAILLERLIRTADQAGYVRVRDHWGPGAYDEYKMTEAIEKFRVRPEINDDDDLPF